MNQSYFTWKCESINSRFHTVRRTCSSPKTTRKTRIELGYPVVYFHDGQMSFTVKNLCLSLFMVKIILPLNWIQILAVWLRLTCMNEYAAWSEESNIPGQQFGGKGVEYAEFVMEVQTHDETIVQSDRVIICSSPDTVLPSLLAWSIRIRLRLGGSHHNWCFTKRQIAIWERKNYYLTSSCWK